MPLDRRRIPHKSQVAMATLDKPTRKTSAEPEPVITRLAGIEIENYAGPLPPPPATAPLCHSCHRFPAPQARYYPDGYRWWCGHCGLHTPPLT